uniref:Putative secreted protein n=1 Tax=Anopheles marajoara TaxID=58244 RepID=A0A2M4CDL4_9DIPT
MLIRSEGQYFRFAAAAFFVFCVISDKVRISYWPSDQNNPSIKLLFYDVSRISSGLHKQQLLSNAHSYRIIDD